MQHFVIINCLYLIIVAKKLFEKVYKKLIDIIIEKREAKL